MKRIVVANVLLSVVLLMPFSASAEQVIRPELERRKVKIPKINVDDYEAGFFIGTLSVEDFGASTVKGFRLAYHLTEDFFIEGQYGNSTIDDSTIRNLSSIPILSDEEFSYYNLSLGANLFSGEVYLGGKWAFGSAIYLKGGAGVADFNGNNEQAFNFGFGLRVLTNDWLAFHIDMEDLIFQQDLLGSNKLTHNFQFHTGLTIYF